MIEAAGAAPAAGGRDTSDGIRKAAQDFEALMIGELLRSAHAGGGSWLGGGEDAAMDSVFGMAEQEVARMLGAQGGFGLTKLIVEGLERAEAAQQAKLSEPASGATAP
jgi:Rod binding domain-containing protein